MKKHFKFIFIFMIFPHFIFTHAFSPPKTPKLKGSREIRISVSQTYDYYRDSRYSKLKDFQLPLREMVSLLFNSAGISISNKAGIDKLTCQIKIKGTSLSRLYRIKRQSLFRQKKRKNQISGTSLRPGHPTNVVLFTGLKIEGTLELIKKGSRIYSIDLNWLKQPPANVSSIGSRFSTANPAKAPFNTYQKYFGKKLVKVFNELWGNESVLMATQNLSTTSIPDISDRVMDNCRKYLAEGLFDILKKNKTGKGIRTILNLVQVYPNSLASKASKIFVKQNKTEQYVKILIGYLQDKTPALNDTDARMVANLFYDITEPQEREKMRKIMRRQVFDLMVSLLEKNMKQSKGTFYIRNALASLTSQANLKEFGSDPEKWKNWKSQNPQLFKE